MIFKLGIVQMPKF